MSIKPKENRLSPLLKYPGGKEKELKYILPNLPKKTANYFEPFIGGGAVYFSLDCKHYYINDKSSELIHLYEMIAEQNEDFFSKICGINNNWMNISNLTQKHAKKLREIYELYRTKKIDKQQLSDQTTEFLCSHAGEFNDLLKSNFNIALENFITELIKSYTNKVIRMASIEEKKGTLCEEDITQNIEGAFKNAFYMHFRYLYNHIEELHISKPFATAIYFFIREFCYSSMFRYNKSGKFNVPYGGISYNQKNLSKKIAYFSSAELVEQLKNTCICNQDFEDFFLTHKPHKQDFIFLDPPYDTEFSTYANNAFGKAEQKRLANFLLKKCKANFMLIIKNTDFILSLYEPGTKCANGNVLQLHKFDKKYFVSFQDRNDKNAQHLLITNYNIDDTKSKKSFAPNIIS